MLTPGQIFAGRYRVIRLIANGGMGAVFEAEHTGTERHVALKLLWPHVMEVQSAREKFELEAKVAARVQSEHIVHVLDAGFDDATRSAYLVMELLQGHTLAAFVVEHQRITPELTVQLLQQVAKGLDAAHALRDARGQHTPLIHRDLKPENLMLVPREGAPALVKILDFGISKILSESRNMSHEIRGTPMYMAYEQIAAEKLSPQTDIWALGLIAYFMLTGRRYWKSANDPEASIQALFMEIVMAPLAPASRRLAEQDANFTLPEAFDAWLTRCIDRVPEQRFESASAAIIALEAALRVKLAPAPPVRAATPAAPIWRAAAPARLSRTESIPALQVPADLRASTVGSMPALESRAFAPRSGFLEELRERPLLAALGLGALILTGIGVALLKDEDPEIATPSAAAPLSPPAAAAPPVAAHVEHLEPAPAPPLAASPQIVPIPDFPPLEAAPPVEPAQQPQPVEQPVRSMRALRPAPSSRAAPARIVPAPSPRTAAAPSSTATSTKNTEPNKPPPAPTAPPPNGFDMR